ncbi:MAG: phosphate ABC transporter substrate-binding protein PstS [Actinomycetota bacterium]|nr:phosphate ABC transporter substrate-binding protein PstS [Actinomycetota bacterium]
MRANAKIRQSRWASEIRRGAALLAVLTIVAGMQALFAPSAAADNYVPISGSGSTWSQNAVDQWRRNLASNNGITINFAGVGSTQGRTDFRNGQVDFAVSEIPYGLSDGGVLDPNPARAFGYMPIVAGGTSFMYNLKIGGKRVTNLRLSGDTITKIFTQVITRWDDRRIAADNPGLALPGRTIVPVVRSDGSGTTAQFTAWMASQYAPQWDDYCHRNGRNVTPCGFTSFYPANSMTSKAGSQGVAGFVSQTSSEGAITYVEYSYARSTGFPVVKVLNSANYYVEPTAPSVAVALLNAKLHPDLTQDLSQVYVNQDPRTYPLSSYSYMILPKDTTSNFSTAKGKTLSEFAYYFLCEGQQQADSLGYSPMPINLVQQAVDQVNQIPGATKKLDRNNLAHCNNPTVSPSGGNLVAQSAPQPSPCDKLGAPTQCAIGTGGDKAPTSTRGGGNAGASGGGPGAAAGATNSAAAGGTGTLADGTVAGSGAATGTIDPTTGQAIDGAAAGSGSNSSGASAVAVSVDVADNRRQMVLASLAAVLLFALILGPPLVARTMRNREGTQT